MLEIPKFAEMPFPEAAQLWLASRKHISSGEHSTRFMYETYIKSLTFFFGNTALDKITAAKMAEYQVARSGGLVPGRPRKAGSSIVNHEMNALQQILTRAGLWAPIAPWYEPLPTEKSRVGCALTPEQERRLFEVARTRPRWHVAYCCSLITANTTAGPGEIRHLQLQDVDLTKRTIQTRLGAKNKVRDRPLELNDDALWAVTELLNRAREKGSIYPHHYLLPHRAHVASAGWNPLKPVGCWRTAWEALRVAAELPKLRMYDLRHHAITKLAEDSSVSEATLEDIAGHSSEKMRRHYSHIRVEARRSALHRLNTGFAPATATNPPNVPGPPEPPEPPPVPPVRRPTTISWSGSGSAIGVGPCSSTVRAGDSTIWPPGADEEDEKAGETIGYCEIEPQAPLRPVLMFKRRSGE